MKRRASGCGLISLTVISAVFVSTVAHSEVLTGTDEVAQLPFWEWRSPVISIRLVQRLPDQSRAYFTARGFSKEHAELIAQSCVFQTVFKNVAKAGAKDIINYDLSKWKVTAEGKQTKLKLREDWAKQWAQLKTPGKAKIAFKWSLLPTRQTYKAQDYNWGMSLYGLEPGTRFDLLMVWTENQMEKTATIKNIECAPDVHLEPKDPFQ